MPYHFFIRGLAQTFQQCIYTYDEYYCTLMFPLSLNPFMPWPALQAGISGERAEELVHGQAPEHRGALSRRPLQHQAAPVLVHV